MTAYPPSSSTLRDHPSYKWLVIGILWCVCLLNYADRQSIFSVFPLIKEQLRLSDLQLGVVAAAFMWVYAIIGPFAGWLSDHVPRHRLILSALIFWSLITAATAMTHNYAQLVICRALGGLGEAFYFPAAMSLISDFHGPATRSRAMSLHQTSVYAGSIAGGAVSGFIGQHYGWRSSFLLFGAAGIVLGLLIWKLLLEPPRHTANSSSLNSSGESGPRIFISFLEVFRNRMALLLIVVFMGANFVAVIFLTWLPTFLVRKFHMSLSVAGFSGTAFLQIASLVGVLCGGMLADSFAKRSRGGRLRTQAIGLLCGVPFLFLAGWSTTVSLLVLGMVGFGFFKGLYDANIFAGLYDVVPEERRGVAAGILNSMGWLGGGFAPIVIAFASARFGMSACISATAGIYLSLGLLLLVGSSRLQKPA